MKVITTVGTSLFTNYDDKNFGKALENREYWKNIERFENRLQPTIEKLQNFINQKGFESCAELSSIEKLKDKYKNLEIYLIATDTLKSYISAKIIKSFLEDNGIFVRFEENKEYIIEYLNVFSNDRDLIKKGSKNLIKVLLKNTTGYNEIYNISGGYKAIIPIMTQVASYKKVNLAYIYEKSEFLIEIPPFPFEIDNSIINYVKDVFEKIDKESFILKNDFEKIIKKLPYEKRLVVEFLFEEIDDNCITTSAIGDILLEDYLANKDIELIECSTKDSKIDGGKHHDKEKVIEFGKKLLQNKYVCKILGSAEYEPYKKDLIIEIEPQNQTGIIKMKIPNSDKATILVKTSGRNKKETAKIAEILKRELKG